jgi:ATP-binding cassette subfamily B protein
MTRPSVVAARNSLSVNQRICLARALAGNPDLLVLDEATSALDDRSEQAIASALTNLRGTITVLMVAHRPTTLATCDRLLTMRDGRLSADA